MAVSFDAVGVGSAALQNGGVAVTFTITVAANAYVLLAAAMNVDTAPTVTCGGVAMTDLGSVKPNNTAPTGLVRLYGLAVATAGSKTISLTSSPSLNYIVMNAVSYLGVGSVSTPTTVFGPTGAMSQSGTCTSGQMTVEAFGATSQSVAASITSGAGGTSRYAAGSASGAYLAIRDAAATTTFTGTSSNVWAGLNVILRPTALTADASLAVAATFTAISSRGQSLGGSLAVAASPSSAISRGQPLSGALAVAAGVLAAARYGAVSGANLVVDATFVGAVQRTVMVDASLAVVAVPFGSATSGSVKAALVIVATSTANASVGRVASASLAVEAATSSGLSAALSIEAVLAVVANTVAQFAGVFWEVVLVPFDDRYAEVLADPRSAIVPDEDRTTGLTLSS